ncbi:MAG TPA: site-specific integrase, partial [Actinomycetes bacterium]|nr:site-specific integrase [Actinomycetes bacterium]
ESLLRTAVLPKWEGTRLDRITATSVRAWVANMQGQKGTLLSASRRRQAYHLLTSMLDAAVEDGRLPRNPARPQETRGRRSGYLPKIPDAKRKRYLTHREVEELANASGDYRSLILLLAYCGLRWGEAAALQIKNVDMLRGRLVIERSVADVNGKLIYGSTKTHAQRTVPVPSFVRAELAPLMVGRGRDDLLFTSPNGSPLRLANWRQRVFRPRGVVHGATWSHATRPATHRGQSGSG